MNKKELTQELAKLTDLPLKDVTAVVDTLFDPENGAIAAALRDGQSISIHGFGKFSTATRAAREGVNPKTGERIQIGASTSVKFAASKSLRGAVK